MKPTGQPKIRVCETGISGYSDALIELHRCRDFNAITRSCRRIAREYLRARVSLSHFPQHPVTNAFAGTVPVQLPQRHRVHSPEAKRIRVWFDPPDAHSGSGGVHWRNDPPADTNACDPGGPQPGETALLFGDATEFKGIVVLRKPQWAHKGRREDLGHLRAFHQHLDVAIRRIQDKATFEAFRSALAALLQRTGHPCLVLDWESRVLFATGAAYGIQSVWECDPRTGNGNHTLASDIRSFIESRKERWLANPARFAHIHRRVWLHEHPSREKWMAKVSLLPCRVHHPHAMRFLVEFVESGSRTSNANTASIKRPPQPLRSLLSPAERALLEAFSGESNRELACSIGKSIHTVKRHLSSIYRKTGATNRYQLLARLNRNGTIPPKPKRA
ncbi:MAG: helix-turn-helix transcriptional regulator [Opitutales bacterium]|nr:helix-turn-helix transcriptional regulator [Opitutales bacterium]